MRRIAAVGLLLSPRPSSTSRLRLAGTETGGQRARLDGQVRHNRRHAERDERQRSLAICSTVQTALRQQRLLFAFQPVVCAATGRIDYFECLLRMRDANGGMITGGEFITPIEQLGLIGFIDDYVLQQTVQELVSHPRIKLGLNISSLTARNGSWLRSLISLLRGRPSLACRLIVEITETAALSDIDETAWFVDRLRDTGCRVALDDFGAGHTSPRQLRILAVDTVKVDSSFVRNLANNREKRIVLRDLLDLIIGFGCTAVAEGVENAEDAEAVRAEGFAYLQGYHLGRPTTERAWLMPGIAGLDGAAS